MLQRRSRVDIISAVGFNSSISFFAFCAPFLSSFAFADDLFRVKSKSMFCSFIYVNNVVFYVSFIKYK